MLWLRRENHFTGVIFFGLMLNREGPKVLGLVPKNLCGGTGRSSQYDDFTLLLGILNGSNAAELCNNCKSLWLTCLENFLYTRKTLCNIVTGYTTGMECSHGKLCTRLTTAKYPIASPDRLRHVGPHFTARIPCGNGR